MHFRDILRIIYKRVLYFFVSKNFTTIKSLRSVSDNGLYLMAVEEALNDKKNLKNSNLIFFIKIY